MEPQEEIMSRLDEIQGQMYRMSLGLYPDPTKRRRFYLNRRHNSLMYEMVDGEVRQIDGGLVFGRLVDIYDKVYERRDEAHKLILVVQADIRYELEMGFNTNPARSILGCLGNMSPQELNKPLQFRPRPGDQDDMALFLNAYKASGEKVDGDYLTKDTSDEELHNRKFHVAFGIGAWGLDWMIERDGKELIPNRLLKQYSDHVEEVLNAPEPHEEGATSGSPEKEPQASSQSASSGGASDIEADRDLDEKVEKAVSQILELASYHQNATCGDVQTEQGTLAQRIGKMAGFLDCDLPYQQKLLDHFGVDQWSRLPTEDVPTAIDCIADKSYGYEIIGS